MDRSAKMWEMRDQAKLVFGPRYEEKIRPWKKVILAVAKKRACSVLFASLLIADPKERHATHLRDVDMLCLNAAVVELIEAEGPEAV